MKESDKLLFEQDLGLIIDLELVKLRILKEKLICSLNEVENEKRG
jgi:hypothetical protein